MKKILIVLSTLLLTAPILAEGQRYVPRLEELTVDPESELRNVVMRYAQDRWAFLRRFEPMYSPEVTRSFYDDWDAELDRANFDAFGVEGRIDWVQLKNRIAYQRRQLARHEKLFAETLSIAPFAVAIQELHEARQRMEPIEPKAAAAALVELKESIRQAKKALERGLTPAPEDVDETEEERIETTKTVAHRTAATVESLRRTLTEWHSHYNGYDPLFSWWTKDPYKKADEALGGYVDFLRQEIVGIREGEDPPIVGDPIGRQGLLEDLVMEMLPYTPEELLAIARQQLDWCDAEMIKASQELGFGDDWKAAVEHVKDLHVEPGQQPELVRDLAHEAVRFVEERGLLTIPPLAKDIWRMTMLTPEMQKMAPFFLGGEVIQVAFPTDSMTHEQKVMSLRGNNVHFSRDAVQHELIPGHHLQGFMTSRYQGHRFVFSTPFWTEGWALYWEMVLWDLDFPRSPEDKIGMLFWRKHRAARIIFSLSFHLGEMTPQEAIDFLVDRVAHERDNATGEVRRSFEGTYSPLYQAAYMLGALQFRALAEELVASGQMTAREFHDAILRGGNMPVEMVRARLKGEKLERDFQPSWRFAD